MTENTGRTRHGRHLILIASAAALTSVVGCSSDGATSAPPSPSSTPPPSATTTVAAGPDAFLADVAASGFGSKNASDPNFISVGNLACQGLADGVSYGQQVQAFVSSPAHPTQQQAEVLVRSAVKNLCPERAGMLPR